MILRPPRASDGPRITEIHAEGLASGNASFRQTPAEGTEVIDAPLARVAETEGLVIGWASLSRGSTRPVYRGVGEVSVYVAASHGAQGVGGALLGGLIDASEQEGWWTIWAHVFAENEASVRLHLRRGFREVGIRRRFGRMEYGARAGRWRDVLLLERRSEVVGTWRRARLARAGRRAQARGMPPENHDVTNQPPPVPDLDLPAGDAALRGALGRGGLDPAEVSDFARAAGRAEVAEWSRLANEFSPRLRTHDRYGHRIDEVEFHPAYHDLMRLGIEGRVSAAAWDGGGRTAHIARLYLMTQADAGVVCPMSMTHAAVAALRADPEAAREWEPRITAAAYDPRHLPASEKAGVTIGMAMTEKQGGSDVRANTTSARRQGGHYLLDGHKWFCSAPMSDAFLTLAQAEGGLTCFIVPRILPGGARNGFHLMRLKDKLGDRSNASSEIEYHGAIAHRLGEEGRGIATIIAMVQETRLDCVAGSAGGMRAALSQALWHTGHRTAFQKRLIDQPAMRTLLADLCLETEASLALAFYCARLMDTGAPLARLAVPAAKFWVCKRQVGVVHEALEAHGGAGYVEEAPLAKLFRAAPLNAVWEGSGNVIALDLLRALRSEAARDALGDLVHSLRGGDACLDAFLSRLDAAPDERDARRFTEDLALCLQAAALKDTPVFEAFCKARLEDRQLAFGGVALREEAELIDRAMPVPA